MRFDLRPPLDALRHQAMVQVDAGAERVRLALITPGAGQALVNLGLIHRDGEWPPYWQGWLEWMRAQGLRRFGLYAWDQGPGLPGDWNGRPAQAFELVFHFNRSKASRPWGRELAPISLDTRLSQSRAER
jgi:hypothetical protein